MTNTRKLTATAMLIAISCVLVLTIHIMIINPFEYDPGDIPILVGGFLFGPVVGLVITFATCILQGLTVSAASGPWGVLMHFIATGTFVVVSSLIYQRKKTLKSAVIALACGGLASVAVMIPANLIVTPLWYGVPVESVKQMMLPVILPFNAFKVGLNGVATFLIYKPVSNLIKLPETKSSATTAKRGRAE